MRVVVLMEFATETGIEIIRELQRLNIQIHSIICVGDHYPEKRNELLNQRTEGQYIRPSFTQLFLDDPVSIYLVDDVNSESCFNLVKSLKVDLLVFEGSKIIHNPIYDLPKIGMLNVHAALLPYFRGCSCMEWSILNDFPLGVTCHFLVQAVDAGPIIERVTLQLSTTDTYADVRTKAIFLVGFVMGQAAHYIVNKGFRYKDGYKFEKGPWYSPMRDIKTINKVRDKMAQHLYNPQSIDDNLPLITVDVVLPSGEIKMISKAV